VFFTIHLCSGLFAPDSGINIVGGFVFRLTRIGPFSQMKRVLGGRQFVARQPSVQDLLRNLELFCERQTLTAFFRKG
jgi:hypothetical protein